MLAKPLVRRRSPTPPRGLSALPLSLRPPRARYGHYSDSLLAAPAHRSVDQSVLARAVGSALGRGQVAELEILGDHPPGGELPADLRRALNHFLDPGVRQAVVTP